jgi:hypothetical protein
MACFNALSDEQKRFLILEGYLPWGYEPEGDGCDKGAEVSVECNDDEAPGPRLYCGRCAAKYLGDKYGLEIDFRNVILPKSP